VPSHFLATLEDAAQRPERAAALTLMQDARSPREAPRGRGPSAAFALRGPAAPRGSAAGRARGARGSEDEWSAGSLCDAGADRSGSGSARSGAERGGSSGGGSLAGDGGGFVLADKAPGAAEEDHGSGGESRATPEPAAASAQAWDAICALAAPEPRGGGGGGSRGGGGGGGGETQMASLPWSPLRPPSTLGARSPPRSAGHRCAGPPAVLFVFVCVCVCVREREKQREREREGERERERSCVRACVRARVCA